MKSNLLTVLIVLVCLVPAAGQTPVPKTAYFHMKGSIDRTIPVTFDVVKLNDTLYCDFLLKDPTLALQVESTGEIPVFCGKADATGAFTLHRPFKSGKPYIKGKLVNGNKITGVWYSENGKNYTVDLTEATPAGSASLTATYMKDSKPLIAKQKSPSAKIQMALILPQESSNIIISDSLRKVMAEKFSERAGIHETSEAILENIKRVFFTTYISSNEQLYKTNKGMSFQWESLKFMHILHNESNIFSFYIINYAFTGGAHGLETYESSNVDLQTGKEIRFNQIFRDGSQDALKERLTAKLKANFSLKPEQKLTDNGFFTDEIKPGDQFYINGQGIGFIYNHYEIAPYSSGIFFIFLNWDEVRDLIRPDSHVRSLF
ncbi:MAG: DUF3298 domain-containing protein [Bacteroidota bacterium]|nr:DUF3298 domain-containing protein [Bacteroidota bacterium]